MKKTEMIEDRLGQAVYTLNDIRSAIANEELTDADLEDITKVKLTYMLGQVDAAIYTYLMDLWGKL